MPNVIQFDRVSEIDGGISGNSDDRTVIYLARLNAPVANPNDDSGDIAILDYAEDNTPLRWDGMPRSGISLEQKTPDRFRVTVSYSRRDPPPAREGEIKYAFKLNTENAKRYYALSQQKFGTNAPNHGVFLNVTTQDGQGATVEGADVPMPVQEFDITVTKNYTDMTQSYLAIVENLAGKINNAPFRGRAAGEVLFKGAEGSISSRGDSEITYHFAVKKNPSLPMTIGGIQIPSGTVVRGWDYIWVEWKTQVDTIAADLAAGARGVYVAQVFESGNFATLGLGV
jgi:hypothetical protein